MESFPSTSKIIAPRLPLVLQRSRLVERLQENRDKKLILVLGQAAQGKSTLAVSCLQALRTPSAWVNLDEEDSDAVNLYHVLGQSLHRALADDHFPVLDCPPYAATPREETARHRDWVQLMFASVRVPIHIIIDGLDRLQPDASAFRFLRVLLEEMPPTVHLVMLSRKMPPLEVQALKVKQEAFVLTNDELAFTSAETRDYFRKVRRLPLTRQQLSKIHRVTEGWAGALVLLAECLGQKLGRGAGSAILDELLDRFSKEVFRYFGEGIFASLSRDVQEFLIKTSIADTLEPDLIKDFTGRMDAGDILHDLAARNLFVQSVYDKNKGWLFRCHQLFREFLQAKLKAEFEEEARLALYLDAAQVHERREEREEAVKYYLEAQAYIQAESLIQKIGMDLLKCGRTGDLAKWIDSLPEGVVLGNPWLLLYHYMTSRLAAAPHHLQHLQRALDLFRERRDLSGQLLALAYLIEAAITRGRPTLPSVHSLLAEGEMLLQTTPFDRHPYERALLWSQLGYGHYLRSGNLRKAYWACTNAYQLGQYLRDSFLQINALVHSYGVLTLLGEFTKGERLANKAEALLQTRSYPELQVVLDLNTVQLHILRGDLQKSAELLEKVSQDVGRHGLTYFYPVAMLYEIWLKTSLGEYDEAERLIESYTNLTLAMGNVFLYGNAFLHSGLGHYQRGDYFRAAESLDQARHYLSSKEARADLHLNAVTILQGLISHHLGDGAEFEMELPEALAYFQEIGSLPFLKEAHLSMALILWDQGRAQEAAAHLRIGLEIMRERQYDRCLLLNQGDFLRVCILALELRVENAWDFAGEVLATRFAALAGAELERLCGHADAKIAENARGIRVRIHRSALPPIRIETLGGFRVSRNSTAIGDKEWPARQPRLLLQAIVAHGSRGVPKDLLIDDLWPESASLSADKTFKVILHRLRRVLEPEIHTDYGPAYVQLKSNLVSLDSELCRIDAEEFLTLMESGARKEKDGDPKGALASYQQALERYKGDFLPEELNSLTINARREELRAAYIRLLLKTAALHESRGTTTKAIACYRKLVQADPLLEEAYRRLMTLYANGGMPAQALRVFEECRKALGENLDLHPDELTNALYRKVLEAYQNNHPGENSP
jgi:LuxR family maltose regulon positive regulatory protein